MIEQFTRRQIDTALEHNDVDRAAVIAEGAIREGQRDPMLLNLAAWRREEAGDYRAASSLLGQALQLSPGDPLIITAMGTVRRKEGRLQEALQTLDHAIGIAPNYANAWLERACAFEAGGALDAADINYRRAAALDPEFVPALAGIAWIAARRSQGDIAREFGNRALARNAHDPVATAALARVDIREGHAGRAIERLEALLADPKVLPENRVILNELWGDALDAEGRHAEAFEAYQAANDAASIIHDRLAFGVRNGLSQTEFIARMSVDLAESGLTPGASAAGVAGEARHHVFLLGYPRSGTTLVENILASASDVEALEEAPTLAEADRAFLSEGGGLNRLAALDEAALDDYRLGYWRGIAARGLDVAGKGFVDMDPLKGMKLPIIARLFPKARIVVMRRDPRDVVWSCFHHGFAPSAAAIEFTDIERAARHYDALMRFTRQSIETLGLDVHILRYEDLVVDFDAVTQRMCDFVGIQWSPALRAFDQTAKRRGITTASADQVGRGLFNGAGQWRRYRDQMAPALAILQPWVEEFGYSAE